MHWCWGRPGGNGRLLATLTHSRPGSVVGMRRATAILSSFRCLTPSPIRFAWHRRPRRRGLVSSVRRLGRAWPGSRRSTTPPTTPTGCSPASSFTVVAAGTRIVGKAARTDYRQNELLVLSISSSELVGEITARLTANDASGTKLRMVLEMRAKGFLAGMFYPLIAQTVGKSPSRTG